VRWLFIGTAVVTLAVNPLFALLVSRYRRIVFISVTYVFFALSLLGFYLVLVGAPTAIGQASGMVFFVWFSVFNLFSTMVFWALMADRFSLEQSKRFFGLISVGGTLGAIAGPWLASKLVGPLGTAGLLPVAAASLGLAVCAAWVVSRLQIRTPEVAADPNAPQPVDDRAVIGGSAWRGFRAVFASPYLLGISAYVLILTVISTFIYFTRLQMVAALGTDLDMRTGVFARIDFYTQLTTLVLQAVVTGHLMKRLGVHITLALLPAIVALGFVGLAISASLAALIVLQATFSAVQRSVIRPARETLFTVVPREDKYKSKAFIDTFVYRTGDVIGAQTEGLLGRLGMGLAALVSVTVPLALAWGVLGIWLGRAQHRRVSDQSTPARATRREEVVTV
jgi:ATP:ADP antiporter, AAA family